MAWAAVITSTLFFGCGSAKQLTGRMGVFVGEGAGSSAVLTIKPHIGLGTYFASGEAAWGEYKPSYEAVGWDFLQIHTNPEMDDGLTARAAGFFEGAATAKRIEQHASNSGVPMAPMPAGVSQFLSANAQFLSSTIAIANTSLPKGHADRRIMYHHSLVSDQLEGLHEGYVAGRSRLAAAGDTSLLPEPLSLTDLLVLQIGGDLEDLADIGTCNASVTTASAAGLKSAFDPGRCSALIRLTSGNKDLFVSQETWADLGSMLRIYKLYDFPFKLSSNEPDQSALVPAQRVSFSSYPGVLNSGDDFYVLSSGLIQQETTIGNSNPALASRFISPLSILEWRRNIVANRLAASCAGSDAWSEYYKRFNSGTYNNQNMCVDFKLFHPGQPLENGTVVITEQIPGYIIDSDVSQRVQRFGYFGSYNTAYNAKIRDESGANRNVETFGSWFSYEDTPRAKIFARDAPHVEDLDAMKRLMRSCDFKNDPLSSQMPTCQFRGWSNCTPAYTAENCIATRGDLNPADGVWGISAFGHRNHVATDAKIAQYSTYNASTVPADIICGPVGIHDNPLSTPTFQWSTSSFEKSVVHEGHVDKFDFDWVRIEFTQ